MQWTNLCEDLDQLCPNHTMVMGQCFNWSPIVNSKEHTWVGVLSGSPTLVRQSENLTQYLTLGYDDPSGIGWRTLHQYFQLDRDLNVLYQQWNTGCDRMRVVTRALRGVRVVRQDPWECLISFICSSNNNISRITQMLSKLRIKYGAYLCTVALAKYSGGCAGVQQVPVECCQADDYKWVLQTPTSPLLCQLNDCMEKFDLYSFPTVDALAVASEDDLRALGMGYRARFIIGTARLVQEKCRAIAEARGIAPDCCADGSLWFEELRAIASGVGDRAPHSAVSEGDGVSHHADSVVKVEGDLLPPALLKQESSRTSSSVLSEDSAGRLHVQQQLMELPGVGRKVADCVALFSLDQYSAVPIDTHVLNIAIRDYAPQLRRSCPGPASVMSSPANVKLEGGSLNTPVVKVKASGKRTQQSGMITDSAGPSPAGSATSDVKSIETKSLTPAVYEQVGQVFRDRFGPYAGWAHSVLFAAELPQFRGKLPVEVQQQMKDFVDLQRSAKKAQRGEKAAKGEESTLGSPVVLSSVIEGEQEIVAKAKRKRN
jgi:3-methyladenine DNA glycosylase/8-oxoguanine DNA glycosylase